MQNKISAKLSLLSHQVAAGIDAQKDEEQEGEAPQRGAAVGEEG